MGRRYRRCRPDSAEARRERVRKYQEGWNLNMSSLLHIRTMKRSARTEVERERAPSQWILPGVPDPIRGLNGLVYPRASFMGLPAELRQEILCMSYNMQELERDLAERKQTGLKLVGQYPSAHPSRKNHIAAVKEVIDEKLNTLHLSRIQATGIVLLGRKIEDLSCLSSVLRGDMEYVSKQWQDDFEAHIGQRLGYGHASIALELRIVARAFENLHDSAFENLKWKVVQDENGASEESKAASKRQRPGMCWYCTEKHEQYSDFICPKARQNPGGWRAKMMAETATIKEEKTLFDEYWEALNPV